MKNKREYRKTLQYKIKMWFYRLTFRDIEKWVKMGLVFLFEIIISIFGFLMLFILPAFFH